MRTVAVDFDGVLHRYSRGWQDGSIYDEPVPGAFAALSALMETTALFIHTSRDPQQVAEWLTARGGFTCATEADAGIALFWNVQGVLLVTSRKLPAVAYIDDRGIRFENWEQALAALRDLEPAPPPSGLDRVRAAVRRNRGGPAPVAPQGFA